MDLDLDEYDLGGLRYRATADPEYFLRDEAKREPGNGPENKHRGELVDDLWKAGYETGPDNNGVEQADTYLKDGTPVQVKSCIHYDGNGGKGRFKIPEETLEGDMENGVIGFVVVDYEGSWDNSTEIDVLMEASMPVNLIRDYLEKSGCSASESGMYSVYHSEITDLAVDIYSEVKGVERDEAVEEILSEHSPLNGSSASRKEPKTNGSGSKSLSIKI